MNLKNVDVYIKIHFLGLYVYVMSCKILPIYFYSNSAESSWHRNIFCKHFVRKLLEYI